MRTRFDIIDINVVNRVYLGADYDDGYAVWINGVEVFRSPEMPTMGNPDWDENPVRLRYAEETETDETNRRLRVDVRTTLVDEMLTNAVERMRVSPEAIPVLAVGGGSILVPDHIGDLPVIRPPLPTSAISPTRMPKPT